jgi:plasmid stability protein
MPTLYIRNFPEALLEKVKEVAARRKRSLGAEVTVLIERAMEQETVRERRATGLKNIARRRRTLPTLPGTADTGVLLREDRKR